jgi:hypothetical protein
LWYSLRVFPWSHLGSDVFDALVKEVVRRAVSYVWDRRKVETNFLKKTFAVSHGLYRKAFVFVSSVRFTSAQKKRITAIQENFPCNRLSPLYANVSSGCDIILTTNFDTLLMIQCKESHA